MSARAKSWMFVAAWFIPGCEQGPGPAPAPPPASTAPPPASTASAEATPASKATAYGAPLTGAPQAELAAVLEKPEAFVDKTLTLSGEVRRACTKKGCWMELMPSGSERGAACRITFKDYGFFVPTNSAGSLARLEGVVSIENVKASYVEHMEAEGATFLHKNPDGTAREVRVVATGVELRPAT